MSLDHTKWIITLLKNSTLNNKARGYAVAHFSTLRISDTISLITNDEPAVKDDTKNSKPLLLLLPWLKANAKHEMKFLNLYLDQGFDVLKATLVPRQLFWPEKGSKIVAADLVQYLSQDLDHKKIVIHGFSVGCYLWAEVLYILEQEPEKFDQVIRRFVGQIFDSITNVKDVSEGAAKAVFTSSTLQKLAKFCIECYVKIFYGKVKRHYEEAAECLLASKVRAPALFFASEADKTAPPSTTWLVQERWKPLGIQSRVKMFKNSPHVGHYYKHPEEYIEEVYTFLEKLDLLRDAVKPQIGTPRNSYI